MADYAPADPPAPKRGRPTKLTEQLTADFADIVRRGNFREAAARHLGVNRRALYRWMRDGKRFPDGRYGTFRRAVLAAEARAETDAVAAIYAAGMAGDCDQLKWFLERKFPLRWGRQRMDFVDIRKRLDRLRVEAGLPPDYADDPAAEPGDGR